MSTYHEEQKAKDTIRLRALLEELPYFLGEFFRGISNTTSIKTRINYANDLKIFFTYLCEHHKAFQNTAFEQMQSDCLNDITAEDIDCFLEYVTYYTRPDPVHKEKTLSFQNDEKGKARKLASIRSMYKYFFKKQKVSSNPAAIVDTPKIHDKKIIRLEANEVADLLDLVESCDTDAMSERQKSYIAHTRKRDLALLTLLLGTGMRVSECVGINISDIDFQNNSVKILRKGGNETTLYFGEEVLQSLLEYLPQREQQKNKAEKEDALFLSTRGTRITVRAVQNIVKKYARIVSPQKKISPHKLRSTYGTALYQETGDIYLVADVLGHADVNTTRKHYAEIEESRRRSASKYVQLRKNQ